MAPGGTEDLREHSARAVGHRRLLDEVVAARDEDGHRENALDAVEGRPAPSIVIRRTQDETRVAVAIVDNGSGIAPEHRGRIAEPFFTTKLTGEGLGLGLSIATTIVRECGGEIRFAEVPGGGTSATICVPLGKRDTARLEAAQ